MILDLTVLVPVIVALVEGIKGLGMDSKYAFLVSMVLGVIGMSFLGEGDMAFRVFEGIVSGLSASGLYSGAVKLFKS